MDLKFWLLMSGEYCRSTILFFLMVGHFFNIMQLFYLAFDNPDLTILLMICIVESNLEKKNDKRKLIRIIIMGDALNCLHFLTV